MHRYININYAAVAFVANISNTQAPIANRSRLVFASISAFGLFYFKHLWNGVQFKYTIMPIVHAHIDALSTFLPISCTERPYLYGFHMVE